MQVVQKVTFQSQNGLILTTAIYEWVFMMFAFQSQNGLILTTIPRIQFIQLLYISIPKWSDFNNQQCRKIRLCCQDFNPKMV